MNIHIQRLRSAKTRNASLAILCLGVSLAIGSAPYRLSASGVPPAAQKETKSAAKTKPSAQNDSRVTDLIRTLFAARQFEQTEISPDGKKVAWVETLIGKDGAPTGNTAIYAKDLQSAAAPRRISAGDGAAAHDEANIAWSPDSKSIAFLSDAAKAGQLQLYLVDATTGTARKLTQLKGALSWPGFSPDGKSISFLFTENATRAAGPLVAETPDSGIVEDHVTEQRLTVVSIASGKVRQISPPDMYVYEYDWSPDGKRFITTAAHGSGDNNWYIAELYTIDASSGAAKSIYKPPLQIANPRWSPSGDRIAFIAGLMSDEGQVGNDIFVLPSAGGSPGNLTQGRKSSPSWLSWTPDGKRILFSEYVEGESAISSLEVASLRADQLWRGPEKISAGAWGMTLSASKSAQRIAVVRQSFSAPPEVWAGAIGEWRQITSINKGLKPAWGDAKSLHWTNGGFPIQGWLLYPRHFDPAKRYPLVVSVHGGPASIALSHWPGVRDFAAALSGVENFVLFPNPRGSFGEGESFVRANVKDFGYGDFLDIMAGVDQAEISAPVDGERLGITGWSYGGYMSMWAVTQTTRFKAAVVGAGLANFQSYYGENRIDKWLIPYFGKSVYDDPDVYARSSPITFIKSVKTPTLLLVGDSDGECPPPQSYEFWHALKTLGVEAQLVIYAREGHIFAKPEHQRDVIERVLTWFEQHLK